MVLHIPHSLSFQHFMLGIFAVANNFPAIGPFLAICHGKDKKQCNRLCNIATLTAFITMVLAFATGQGILEFFGISVDAFRITGGLLLGLSGTHMVNSKTSVIAENEHKSADFSKVISVAIIPIGIPLTTGAGTISTITIFTQEIKNGSGEYWPLLVSIILMTVIIYLFFRYSTLLLKVLGHTGMNVMVKITGLFTLAIGIQFIISGLTNVFPGLV